MSSIEELNRLRERIKRIAIEVTKGRGEGYEYSYTFEDGTTTQYVIRNLKSPQEFEDQLCNLFVWVWSLKDYIKAWASKHNVDKQIVEDTANTNRDLAICADLANLAKHSELNSKGRSGLRPRLGEVGFSAPQESIGRLAFVGAQVVEMHIAKPELVKFQAPILDQEGNELGDALEIVTRAIECWELLLSKLGHSPING